MAHENKPLSDREREEQELLAQFPEGDLEKRMQESGLLGPVSIPEQSPVPTELPDEIASGEAQQAAPDAPQPTPAAPEQPLELPEISEGDGGEPEVAAPQIPQAIPSPVPLPTQSLPNFIEDVTGQKPDPTAESITREQLAQEFQQSLPQWALPEQQSQSAPSGSMFSHEKPFEESAPGQPKVEFGAGISDPSKTQEQLLEQINNNLEAVLGILSATFGS